MQERIYVLKNQVKELKEIKLKEFKIITNNIIKE